MPSPALVDDLGLSELTIATLLGHASAKKGSVTRGYISKPDAVLLAAADKVNRLHLGSDDLPMRTAPGSLSCLGSSNLC
jgi:hypothetical protein